MTANQIEYWKLNETKRHNIETENMERPYKESLTALNKEYIINQTYVRDLTKAQERAAYAQEAAGYASAAANYASAALSYERINTEQTQQGLNLEKQYTEQSIQDFNASKTAGQMISNTQQQYITSEYQYNGLLANDKVDYISFNTTSRQKGAKTSVNQDWYKPKDKISGAFTGGMYTGAILFGN